MDWPDTLEEPNFSCLFQLLILNKDVESISVLLENCGNHILAYREILQYFDENLTKQNTKIFESLLDIIDVNLVLNIIHEHDYENIVKFLFSNSSTINKIFNVDNNDIIISLLARHPQYVKNVLLTSCWQGYYEVVQLLTEKFCIIQYINTALKIAFENGYHDIFETLLNSGTIKSKYYKVLLKNALKSHDFKIIELILQYYVKHAKKFCFDIYPLFIDSSTYGALPLEVKN